MLKKSLLASIAFISLNPIQASQVAPAPLNCPPCPCGGVNGWVLIPAGPGTPCNQATNAVEAVKQHHHPEPAPQPVEPEPVAQQPLNPHTTHHAAQRPPHILHPHTAAQGATLQQPPLHPHHTVAQQPAAQQPSMAAQAPVVQQPPVTAQAPAVQDPQHPSRTTGQGPHPHHTAGQGQPETGLKAELLSPLPTAEQEQLEEALKDKNIETHIYLRANPHSPNPTKKVGEWGKELNGKVYFRHLGNWVYDPTVNPTTDKSPNIIKEGVRGKKEFFDNLFKQQPNQAPITRRATAPTKPTVPLEVVPSGAVQPAPLTGAATETPGTAPSRGLQTEPPTGTPAAQSDVAPSGAVPSAPPPPALPPAKPRQLSPFGTLSTASRPNTTIRNTTGKTEFAQGANNRGVPTAPPVP